ncbi:MULTISPECIES: DUF1481 domain-containing protein [Sodalis]|uniref:Uncharacterized protein DUF1481 n=1 Tax=Sodalis ligni TaxID=2697027 RepID=A0A4R1NFD9_9GAMM|nr:DUF1481 domain-containing protein [Sodalis ligni]TCL05667.1 uncharacterized protein DUF1481 [Sodalis ligni]
MPLLFARRWGWIGLFAVMLNACSHRQDQLPSFTASGYIADRGVVRLWRNDDQAQRAVTILSVYSPYEGDNTTITRYQYLDDQVRQINRTQNGAHAQVVQIRFDDKGNVSFMQRQRDQVREKLSDDELALYQFEANRLLQDSHSLRVGHVHLVQGQWRDGAMYNCQDKAVNPNFDGRSLSWIAARSTHSARPLGVAWLEAPEGTQLLLVANEDFCRWQPKKSDL